jgi:hypothetical protein
VAGGLPCEFHSITDYITMDNFELSADDYVQDYVYISGPECGISEFEEAGNIDGEVQPVPSVQHEKESLYRC